MTYSDILAQFMRNIGQENISANDPAYATILADFNTNLGARYHMVMAKMRDYATQLQKTTTTVASQQYYHYPVDVMNIESIVVTIGQVNYPTTICNSQWQWDWLNAIQVQPTAIPQFILPRKVDFGVYPTPKDAYTLTFNYHYKDRNLSVPDYLAGTVTMTNASTAVTGSGVTWTAAMIGRYFEITDTTNSGQGYFYKIVDIPTSGTLTLETSFEGLGGASLSYRIGEIPDFPDEGHSILVDGASADYFSGMRHDLETGTWYDNKFFTGSGVNTSRNYGESTISGGLIGLYNTYTDRNQERVIDRKKEIAPFTFQNWGMNLH
jgi:hypothetical protein